MTARAVKEWIGKTPDTPAPPRVRDRILLKYDNRCYWSGRPIRPGDRWNPDHIIALINGGENRESNLAPILEGKEHKEKTAKDVAEKKWVYRKRRKHRDSSRPKHQWGKRKLQSRGFQKRWSYADGD